MKVSYLNRASSLSISIFIFLACLGFTSISYAQDGSPDLYIPSELDEIEVEEPALEDESYVYENQFYETEEIYYKDQVQEDTSSVSMLTFNFLFYIVYKLKFSEGDNKQEQSKTADD